METGAAAIGVGSMSKTRAASYGKGGLDSEVLPIVESDLACAQSPAASFAPNLAEANDMVGGNWILP